MIRQYYNRYSSMKQDADRYRKREHTEIIYCPRNLCRCGNFRTGFMVVDTDTGEILSELLLCSLCEYETSGRLFQ